MADFGMQMAGGRKPRGASPDVYTALMAIATVALLAAALTLWFNGGVVGPDGSPIALQEASSIKLSD